MNKTEARNVLKVMDIMFRENGPFENKLQELVEFIVKRMKSHDGSIMALEGASLVVKAATNRAIVGSKQKTSEDSVSIRALHEKKELIIDDFMVVPGLLSLMRRPEENEKTMFISAPIISHGVVSGIFNVSGKTNGRPYTTKEAGTLNRWIRRISPIVENARLNHELKKEKGKLARANRKLKKLETLKRDLVNMVVHDMKSPLSEIIANIDIVAEMETDSLLKSAVQSASIGATTLSRMIGALLDISKMEDGKLELSHEPVDPVQIARTSVDGLSAFSGLNEVELVVNPPVSKVNLIADRRLLERVLTNLLVNAVEHSPTEGRVRVDIALDKDAGEVEFRVTDQGEGAPEGELEKIFEKFYQVGGKKARGGSGLGLTFCKMAVTAHGGVIRAENSRDKGSAFVFRLPLDTRNKSRKRRKPGSGKTR